MQNVVFVDEDAACVLTLRDITVITNLRKQQLQCTIVLIAHDHDHRIIMISYVHIMVHVYRAVY